MTQPRSARRGSFVADTEGRWPGNISTDREAVDDSMDLGLGRSKSPQHATPSRGTGLLENTGAEVAKVARADRGFEGRGK